MPDFKQIKKSDGKTYTVRDNRDRFFYPEEWFKFHDKLKKKQSFTFDFLINTGARINEARNVKKEDIDTERKRIILRVTKIKGSKKEKSPKPRIIPISSQFAKHLKNDLKDLKAEDYIPILSTPATNIALKKALKLAQIKDWYMFSAHNLRKTLETWLVALDVDGLKIIAHFGHTGAVASKHYISTDTFSYEEKSKIRMVIGDLYEK